MTDVKKEFRETILPVIMKEGKYGNVHQVPRLVKIIVNMGLNDAVSNKGIIEKVAEQIAIIAGQKALVTKAKKSISAFKIRAGMPLGLKVTLRGKRMFDFWEKLVKIVLPRQRDFKGVSVLGFDRQGNLNLGFKEQTLFPDLEYDRVDKIRGLELTFVTSARTDVEAQLLLEKMGMPFKKVKVQEPRNKNK
jgi:large subunit ribosomal protein L5